MNDTRPPVPSTVRSRWTSKDEATLQELTERKQRIDRENRDPIIHLILGSSYPGGHDGHNEVTDWLVDNATQLRVLLEPFDRA